MDRLAKQLAHEVVVDRDFVNSRFAYHSGARQLDRVLGNQLDTLLNEHGDAMWLPRTA
ncbi:hypothetical protein [Halomonas sp. PR-M31]|uniref:hypothetical protein n=1 Tax=Halomonas sp. PR-M31 TaxID=1471202 RepID=UPI00345FB66B